MAGGGEELRLGLVTAISALFTALRRFLFYRQARQQIAVFKTHLQRIALGSIHAQGESQRHQQIQHAGQRQHMVQGIRIEAQSEERRQEIRNFKRQ
ncbi:hypothetical protein D3C81_1603460 [compost metagenome]